MTTTNHVRASTLGLPSAASLVLGVTLLVHGDAIDQSGQRGAAWMAWGVFFVLVPVLVGIGAAVVVIGRELARDMREYSAWKRTLTPEQHARIQVAETATLYATRVAIHHHVKKQRAKTAATFQEREAATRATFEKHKAAVQARDESFQRARGPEPVLRPALLQNGCTGRLTSPGFTVVRG